MNKLLILTSALLALVAGCKKVEKPAAGDVVADGQPLAHVMRTYEIPSGHAKSLERLLRGNSYPIQVVTADGAQTQFVKLNPQFTRSGFFVLSAPESIHTGVAEILAKVAATEPAGGPPSLSVTYWLVLAWPAARAEAPIPPDLQVIGKALETTAELGPRRFELLERLHITALDGEEGKTTGQHGKVRHTASSVGDGVELRLSINIMGGRKEAGLETAVSVHPDQLAVLGQVGYIPALYEGDSMPTLLFVARARPAR
jgi:hypothetical protein